jgi:hypothetical protein
MRIAGKGAILRESCLKKRLAAANLTFKYAYRVLVEVETGDIS